MDGTSFFRDQVLHLSQISLGPPSFISAPPAAGSGSVALPSASGSPSGAAGWPSPSSPEPKLFQTSGGDLEHRGEALEQVHLQDPAYEDVKPAICRACSGCETVSVHLEGQSYSAMCTGCTGFFFIELHQAR